MRPITFTSLERPTFAAKNGRISLPNAARRPVETPAQAIHKDAFAPIRVTDDTGCTIEAARLKPSERFQIKRMMGAEAASSSAFDNLFLVSHCVSLDGKRINRPASLLLATALMDRFQDAGLKALEQAVAGIYGFDKDEGVQDIAKN